MPVSPSGRHFGTFLYVVPKYFAVSTFLIAIRVELNWLFNVTINDISVIHVTAHRCAGGLKKKFDLRSGSQRHRHFVGFFKEGETGREEAEEGGRREMREQLGKMGGRGDKNCVHEACAAPRTEEGDRGMRVR